MSELRIARVFHSFTSSLLHSFTALDFFSVQVRIPAHVAGGGFMNGLGDVAEAGGYMMLEAFAADEAQQLLQVGNLGNARAAEGLERIVGEAARACIAADDAVVGGGVIG